MENSRKSGTSEAGWDYNVEIRESKKEIFVKMKASPEMSFEISPMGQTAGTASESNGAGVSPVISHGQDGHATAQLPACLARGMTYNAAVPIATLSTGETK
jgi:hypothetical protein